MFMHILKETIQIGKAKGRGKWKENLGTLGLIIGVLWFTQATTKHFLTCRNFLTPEVFQTHVIFYPNN